MTRESAEPPSVLGKKHALLLMAWLSAHREAITVGELSAQLGILLEIHLPPRQKLHVLEELFVRLTLGLEENIIQFVGAAIPLNAHTYRQVNALLDVVGDFSLGYEGVLAALPADASEDEIRLCLERVIFCLYQHLLLSYLVSRPAGLGIWQRLHSAYLRSRQSTQTPIPGYREALLLACAQPASFSSQELAHVIEYTQQFAPELQISETQPEFQESVFWIPIQQDFYAFPLRRRSPPPGGRIFYFSCRDIVARMQEMANGNGTSPVPSATTLLSSTKSGKRILRRLIARWGNPGQRRFPRHRKSYRGLLCVGLDKTYLTLKASENPHKNDYSYWMVTNESPDGYAFMFLHGNPGRIHAGDVITLQPDKSGQGSPSPIRQQPIGLIRWAISETPEHLEIGVQILSPTATPAILSVPDSDKRIVALILPKQPPHYNLPGLLIAANEITDQDYETLLIEKDGEAPCPIHVLKIREQNRLIEIFSILEPALQTSAEETEEKNNQEPEAHQETPDQEPELHQEAPDQEPEPHQEAPDQEPEPHQETPDQESEPHQEAPDQEPEPHQETPDQEPELHQETPDQDTEPGAEAENPPS
jgi:hypothetical protein